MALFDRLESREDTRGIDMARELQTSLLPATRPPGPDPAVAWRSIPADAVGGDFYDVLAGPHEDVFLVIGDVSGRGPTAALFMAMTSCLLRILAPDAPGPGFLLEMANRILYPHLRRRGLLVTAQCVRYRPAAGQITLASAGHLWPYANVNGHYVELPAEGVPLGILPEAAYPESTTAIGHASRLVMYTDGVVESKGTSGEMYGFDRLRARLEAMRSEHPERIVASVVEDVQAFAAGRPADDVSVVAAAWS